MSIVAKFMKVTISPIVASPCKCSHVPSRKMPRIVNVAEARVATEARAHHDSTGIWALSTVRTMSFSARASSSMRVKL